MTVNETIERLKEIQKAGYGSCLVRSYSELSYDPYRPIKIIMRLASDNDYRWDESYGDWIEVQ